MARRGDALPDERDRAIDGVSGEVDDLALEDGDLAVEELPDGGALVTDEEKEGKVDSEFFDNLAETLEETELDNIARDLLRRIEHDKEARQKRDLQYEEGLKRTGLGDEAPGGANFTGASKVVHPMLTEASVDFHASSMKELFPPTGPVRTEIIPEQTPEQLKIADRQFRYMNWQLTEQIEEYPDELSVTMTQLPMGGSQYMKFWDDETEGRPCTEFLPIDDLLIPYGCQSFWRASRITHVQRLSENEFEDRLESQMYRDTKLASPSETPETTKAGRASEKIEGVEPPPDNIDGLRIVYETNTFLKLSVDENKRLPYLITIDERTSKVLSLYRNWEEDDRRKKRLHWIVDYNFIPWRGAYKMGIAQMIGGLSAASTGALRALLDSALVQTIPVLAKLKAQKFGAQTKSVDPMSVFEVEAGVGVDDIRKALMALPFNPPSPVLFQLLGWLSETAKGVVTTAEEKIADAGNNMPVGTSLALIEQGAKVFSAIHAGLHRSQRKALKILARLNKYHVDKEAQMEKFGEIICTEEDFKHPLGVIPVSDPNIFSEGQRYAQMQLVMGYAQGMDPKTGQPTATGRLHNLYECLKSAYTLAKIPNVDKILPPPKEPSELNAAAENSAAMLGSPIMAFPEQDHFSHLETHLRFVMDPLLGGSPAVVPTTWPGMVEHIKQHLSFLYGKTMHDLASTALGSDISEALKDKKSWPKVDKLLAAASRIVHDELSKILQPLGPQMNQMIQKIESMKPPAPVDPGSAALQVAKLEDARERERMKQEGGLKGADLQEKTEKDKAAADAKQRELDIKETDVNAKHGLAADAHSEKVAHGSHTRAMDILKTAHDMHSGERDHELAAGAQEHSQGMDIHAAGQDAAAQAHSQQLAEADHTLRAGGQAHDQELSRADHSLRADGQAHDQKMNERTATTNERGQAFDQTMGAADHVASVQRDVHGQRMAEADHEQRQTEHKDGLKQQEAQRKDEGKRHAADLKVKAATAKKPPEKPKKS